MVAETGRQIGPGLVDMLRGCCSMPGSLLQKLLWQEYSWLSLGLLMESMIVDVEYFAVANPRPDFHIQDSSVGHGWYIEVLLLCLWGPSEPSLVLSGPGAVDYSIHFHSVSDRSP